MTSKIKYYCRDKHGIVPTRPGPWIPCSKKVWADILDGKGHYNGFEATHEVIESNSLESAAEELLESIFTNKLYHHNIDTSFWNCVDKLRISLDKNNQR